MTKFIVALSLVSLTFGCQSRSSESSANAAAQANAQPKIVSVQAVADWLRHKTATVLDANGKDVRESMGTVPGAVLLSSSHDYSVNELPAAKGTKLVFYCGGEMCRASDSAAARAAKAGYSDVNIMRAGILGWKNAGQPTQIPRS